MTDIQPSWLKRNAFLVAAGGLPLVVVVFFVAATAIPRWTVDDPAHDVIFALTRYDRPSVDVALEFKMEEGRLTAIARRIPANGYGPYQQLYRYHVRSAHLEALSVEVPDDMSRRLADATVVAGENAPSETFEPGVLVGVPLSANRSAPDGYEFVHQNSGHRGLFGELFGMGRRHTRVALSKRGRLVNVESANGGVFVPYHAAVFLAWVEEPS